MPLTCRRVQSSVSDEVTPQAAAGSLWTERRLVTDLSVRLFKCARKHTLRLINSTDFTTSRLLQIHFQIIGLLLQILFIPWELSAQQPTTYDKNLNGAKFISS